MQRKNDPATPPACLLFPKRRAGFLSVKHRQRLDVVRPGKEVKTLAVSQSPLARLDERVAVPLERREAAAEVNEPR